MILSKVQIEEEIEKGNIIYENKPQTNLIFNQSIDVRLGQYLWVIKKGDADFQLIDLQSNQQYQIFPGDFVIAHTEEFIGTKAGSNLHPSFKLKSSAGRNGIMHTLAGHGDCGFFNRWAMEFTVMRPIVLKRYTAIAQIYFLKMDDLQANYALTGSYQDLGNVYDLMKYWSPTDLLPKKLKIII